jgi:hypothetical protein
MFSQVSDFCAAWKSSKLDAFIWLATFGSVITIDIDYGLAIGVAVSLVTLLWRNQRAYACTLGEIPNTGIYVDTQRFSAVSSPFVLYWTSFGRLPTACDKLIFIAKLSPIFITDGYVIPCILVVTKAYVIPCMLVVTKAYVILCILLVVTKDYVKKTLHFGCNQKIF